MLGFLIGVSIMLFVIGAYLIIKSAKEKKALKEKNKEKGDDDL